MKREPSLEERCAEAEAFASHVRAVHAEMRKTLPDMDSGDLLLILEVLLRPFGSGQRFFLREIRSGVHVL